MEKIQEVKDRKKPIGTLYAVKMNHFAFDFYPEIRKKERDRKIKELKEVEKRTGLKIDVRWKNA